MNTVLLRIDLSRCTTFREALLAVRRVTLDAYAHQEAPFGLVTKTVDLTCGPDLSPPVPMLINFEYRAIEPVSLPGLTISSLDQPSRPVPDTESGDTIIPSVFDFITDIAEQAEALHVTLRYNDDLFTGSSIRRILDKLQMILTEVADGLDMGMDQVLSGMAPPGTFAAPPRCNERGESTS
jgi:hypothetical protein